MTDVVTPMQATKTRFDEIIERLREFGWVNLRVDTLVHPIDDGTPRRERPTIKHHYSGGQFTISCEPDRNWHKPHPDANAEPVPWEGRTVTLTVGKELPTVDEAVRVLGPSVFAPPI